MTAPWIAASRLAPPDPPDGALDRRFPADAAVTVLAGGPGAGKSQALAAMLRAAPAGAVKVWLACDPYDADAGELFHHLLAALRQAVPATKGNTRRLATLGPVLREYRVTCGSIALTASALCQGEARARGDRAGQPGLALAGDLPAVIVRCRRRPWRAGAVR